MFEDLKEWKRGSGELGVLDAFYGLAKKSPQRGLCRGNRL
jgi:hypothetical protein